MATWRVWLDELHNECCGRLENLVTGFTRLTASLLSWAQLSFFANNYREGKLTYIQPWAVFGKCSNTKRLKIRTCGKASNAIFLMIWCKEVSAIWFLRNLRPAIMGSMSAKPRYARIYSNPIKCNICINFWCLRIEQNSFLFLCELMKMLYIWEMANVALPCVECTFWAWSRKILPFLSSQLMP